MGLLYAEQVEYMDVESMQKTHENEIEILNSIDKLAILYEREEATKEELVAKIEEYIKHVHKHFEKEEQLMQTYNFPLYEMHKTAHDMFLVDLEYAIKSWKNYENINKILNFIRKTPEWIILHVNSVDTPTAHYLAKKIVQREE